MALHPLKRLALLVEDWKSSYTLVERSVKFHNAADKLSQRLLVGVYNSSHNTMCLARFAEKSGLESEAWLADAEKADAIGVAVSGDGSIRLYNQFLTTQDTSLPLYRGYKFFPDSGLSRVDDYVETPRQAIILEGLTSLVPVGLESVAEPFISAVEQSDAVQVQWINSPRRRSAFVQLEPLRLRFNEQNILPPSLNSLLDLDVRRVAMGSDERDARFMSVYFLSTTGWLRSLSREPHLFSDFS